MNLLDRVRGLEVVSITKWTEANTADQTAHTTIQLEFEDYSDHEDVLIGFTISTVPETYNKIRLELKMFNKSIAPGVDDIEETNKNFAQPHND